MHLAASDTVCLRRGISPSPWWKQEPAPGPHACLAIPMGASAAAELFQAPRSCPRSPRPSCSGAGREGSGFLPLPSLGAGASRQLRGDQLGTRVTRSSPVPSCTMGGTRADLRQSQTHQNTTAMDKRGLDLRTPSPRGELWSAASHAGMGKGVGGQHINTSEPLKNRPTLTPEVN